MHMSFKQFARVLGKRATQQVAKTGNRASPAYIQVGCRQVHLDRNEMRPLSAETQIIHVTAGIAWISTDGTDLIVNSGEEIVMRRGKHPALISSAGKYPLEYEVRYAIRSSSAQTLIPRLIHI
jgi:hypothetical protein